MALPRFVLLKSNANNKYLRYIKEKANHAFLRFSYQVNDGKLQDRATIAGQDSNISYPHLKFEVEKSKTVDGLVHIRSCYNNKYWTWKSVPNSYIAAEAHEAEEDQSKSSCTLFKPIVMDTYVDDAFPMCKAHKIQLLHICGLGQHSLRTSTTALNDADGSMESFLAVVGDDDEEPPSRESNDLAFTVIDVEESVTLPEHVTFMGPNNKYSTSKKKFWDDRLSFSTSDIGGENVANKVYKPELLSPLILLRDLKGLKHWNVNDKGNIVELSSLDKATVFTPIRIGNDYTALKCAGKTESVFVGCGSDESLTATSTTITNDCMLRVGEPVLNREILEANYNLDDFRIHSVSVFEMYSDTRRNLTNVEQEGSFQVKYTKQRTMKWSQSATVNLGITASFSFGVPVIVGTAAVGVSYGKDQTMTWDEEVVETEEITYTQTVKIPPMTKVTLTIIANRGFCDVPFTCKVRDVMTNGDTKEYTKTDGRYSGCNEFQFDTKIVSEDLTPE